MWFKGVIWPYYEHILKYWLRLYLTISLIIVYFCMHYHFTFYYYPFTIVTNRYKLSNKYMIKVFLACYLIYYFHKFFFIIPLKPGIYSRTCYGQPPLWHRKSGLLMQVAAYMRFICIGLSFWGMAKWPPIGGWLLMRVPAHSRFYCIGFRGLWVYWHCPFSCATENEAMAAILIFLIE